MGRGKKPRSSLRATAFAADEQPFNPTVTFAEGEVTIWLPELLLGGNGASFEDAKVDLIDELRTYATQFKQTPALRNASNRKQHAALLEQLEAADAEGQLEELLFAAPGQVSAPVR